ncbi:MAG: hypothetical protein M0R06_15490 [Sphaerochaeta sp.]|nr:hypothetical protein [Sphaerochaeta sp.]
MDTGSDLTLRQAFALLFAVTGMIAVMTGYTPVPGGAPLHGLAVLLAVMAGVLVGWGFPGETEKPVVTRETWLALQPARGALLASATEARDKWALVSIRHLDRITPGLSGGLVYSPTQHAVVAVWRGIHVHPIAPQPLSVFGLEAPRPFHRLRKDEVYRVRERLATMRGVR